MCGVSQVLAQPMLTVMPWKGARRARFVTGAHELGANLQRSPSIVMSDAARMTARAYTRACAEGPSKWEVWESWA